MDVKFKRRAFVFSFLAFFLSILIFAFGSYYIFSGDYTKDLDFKEARIQVVNNELSYFKNVYIQNAFSFSMYNSLRHLLENESLILKMDNNYTKMNKILAEMIINGSIDGIVNSNINSTSVNYLLSLYKDDFYKNYKGNLTYNIKAINIYEDSPFYVSIQVSGEYMITTIDNISSWYFNDTFIIKVPIYDFNDPEFTLNTDSNYTIRYVDLYNSSINWTLETFNDSLKNVYSTMYIESFHKYTLGTSFLNRLINNSESSYKKVMGFYSFDYDEEKKEVYDTSGFSILGTHYGNTRLLMKFDYNTVNSSSLIIEDLSAYQNKGFMFGDVNCDIINSGIYNNGCYFDGDADYVEILNNASLDFENNTFSLVVWAKFNNGNITENETLVSKQESFILQKSSSLYGGNIDFLLYDGVDYDPKIRGINVSVNTWNLIIVTYDKNYLKLYINGILINSFERGSFNTNSFSPMYLGKDFNGNFFNGTLDEVGVYSKVLDDEEISNLYKERKALLIDYKISLYGKAIEFDGQDDYIEINQTIFRNSISSFSLDLWFKPTINNSNSTLFSIPKGVGGNNLILVAINYTNKTIIFDTYHDVASQNTMIISNTNLLFDSYNYLSITYDGSFKKIYLNGKLINSTNVVLPFSTSLENIIIGADRDSSVIYDQFYSGLIDEIKIYNKTLTNEEIIQNYYNFASKGKGCCNYITLINPNLMGYNDSINYNKNISYNSKLFFDYYKRNIYYNLTLWNLSNITSQQTDKVYYNFMLDDCMIQAYNIFGFDYSPENVTIGLYNDSCYNYVREGIY